MENFTYYLYGPDRPVTPAGPLWQKPLPLSRNSTIHDQNDRASWPTLGDYFETVTRFLTLENKNALARAVSAQTGQSCQPDEIKTVSITLEKHGAFYHPACVRVTTSNATTSFVANVAVSQAGSRIIDREFQLLQQLDRPAVDLERMIPAAFYQAEIGPQKWPIYLGQWFDGYHEFHLTVPQESDPNPIVVWAPEPFFITQSSQKEGLCHKIARILTHFYNPLTFEQIGPWHHAAGDFIVQSTSDTIDAKLITVRDYEPTAVAPAETTPASILEGLLFFFLHLSIQMRLDRLDGTGALVWADNWAVNGMVNGFFEALLEKSEVESISLPLSSAWGFYLARQTPEQLQDALETVAMLYPANSPEHDLITKNIPIHISDLRKSLKPIADLFEAYLD